MKRWRVLIRKGLLLLKRSLTGLFAGLIPSFDAFCDCIANDKMAQNVDQLIHQTYDVEWRAYELQSGELAFYSINQSQ